MPRPQIDGSIRIVDVDEPAEPIKGLWTHVGERRVWAALQTRRSGRASPSWKLTLPLRARTHQRMASADRETHRARSKHVKSDSARQLELLPDHLAGPKGGKVR